MKQNAAKQELQNRLEHASKQINELAREAERHDANSAALRELQEQRDSLADAIERLEHDTSAAADDFTQRIDEGLGTLETRLSSVRPTTGRD